MLILACEVGFHKLSFVFSKRVKGRGENTVKNDVSAIMVIVFTNAEIRYLLEGLFNPFRFYICNFKFFGLAVCFYWAIARKRAMPSPYISHTTYSNTRLSYFKRKRSL